MNHKAHFSLRGISALAVFSLLLSACSGGLPGGTLIASTGLRVWLDQPPDGAFLPLAPFTLKAHARDAGGTGVETIVFLVSTPGGSGPVSVGSVHTDHTQPLVYAEVEWNPSAPGEYYIQAKADNHDSYVFSEVAHICVGQAGQLELTHVTFCSQGAQTTATPTSQTSAGGIVRGVVYADLNADGDAADPGEGPLDGVTVSLSGCGPAASQVTAADGQFNFTGLPAGSCLVKVDKTNWFFTGSFPAGLGYPFPAASDPSLPTSFSMFMSTKATPQDKPTTTPTATKKPGNLPTETPTKPAPKPTDTPTKLEPKPTDTPQPAATLTCEQLKNCTPTPTQTVKDSTPPTPKITAISDKDVYYVTGCGANTTTIQAAASDPSGIASVVLYYSYRDTGGSIIGPWRSVGMSPLGGDTYSGTINPAAGGGSGEAYNDLAGANGFIDFYINATDGAGNSGNSGADAAHIFYCHG